MKFQGTKKECDPLNLISQSVLYKKFFDTCVSISKFQNRRSTFYRLYKVLQRMFLEWHFLHLVLAKDNLPSHHFYFFEPFYQIRQKELWSQIGRASCRERV